MNIRGPKFFNLIDKNAAEKPVLPWRPKLKVFKGCNGKLAFDPYTGVGTSYEWYIIAKFSNSGEMLLNVYPYSVTTRAHVKVMRQMLEQLGIPYKEVSAPGGLGRMNEAVTYHAKEYVAAKVESFHARAGSGRQKALLENIRHHTAALDTLDAAGYKRPSKAYLLEEEKVYTAARHRRLHRETVKRAMERVQVLHTPPEMQEFAKTQPGIHMLCAVNLLKSDPSWESALRKAAVNNSLKVAFIHVEVQRFVTCQLTGKDPGGNWEIFMVKESREKQPVTPTEFGAMSVWLLHASN